MIQRTNYLLDTNTVSETRKARPDPGLLAMMMRTAPDQLYLSVLTLGEIRKGVALRRRRDAAGADMLSAWADGIEFAYSDRILPIDAEIARTWGELSAQRSRPVVDTLIAATAVVHGLTLVTRNVDDFRDIDVKLLDPFTSSLP